MTTTVKTANETLILIQGLKSELSKYMGCKSLKALKKDSKFISMVNEIKEYQSLWSNLVSDSINDFKLVKCQSILN